MSIEGDPSADCGRDSYTSGGTPMKDDGRVGDQCSSNDHAVPVPACSLSKRLVSGVPSVSWGVPSALGDVHRYRAALLTMECADYEEQQDAERCGESEHTFIVAKFGPLRVIGGRRLKRRERSSGPQRSYTTGKRYD